MHAAKDCNHFTQSAGLIAAHLIADALSDEFPFFLGYYEQRHIFGSATIRIARSARR
jgi:hypothetical protein